MGADARTHSPTSPEWADLNAEIRELLDDDEYTQARASTLTAYYTPGPVVKAMWDALDIGSAPIQVLEPGCGTGNFMAGIPENIKANVSGVELDPISARIAAALNPDARSSTRTSRTAPSIRDST